MTKHELDNSRWWERAACIGCSSPVPYSHRVGTETRGNGVEPTGRLELTWANKHLRLITTEDGGYDWVAPDDARANEVRLLHEVGGFGEPASQGGNLLVEGDALHVLTALNRIPALADQYAGKVRLVYVDPPFNTGQAFAHYDDNLEHSVWLSMLRDRLVQLRPLLAPNGSIWVHLDDAEVHRCRVVMDEVLGSANFVATVAWQKAHSRRNDATLMSSAHDQLLVYAKDKTALSFNRLPAGESTRRNYTNPDGDPRGDWISIPFHAPNIRPNLTYPIVGPSGREHWPTEGRCWSTTQDRFEVLLAEGRMYFGQHGDGVPRRKRYWNEEAPTVVPWTWWSRDEVGDNQEARSEARAITGSRTAFATPKPERLMRKVVQIATDPGDVVLDCFAGSGTTAAVAHKMDRRWVTSEREPATVEEFTRPRLERVVAGEDPGGVTLAEGWAGGGGFHHVRVGPSMFDFDEDSGDVFLADWATNGAFSAAVAAQLGFEPIEDQPFCGTIGRTRLAVLDGVVGEAEIEYLVSCLGERERMVVVGKALTDGAEATLRRLSPGSRSGSPDGLTVTR